MKYNKYYIYTIIYSNYLVMSWKETKMRLQEEYIKM